MIRYAVEYPLLEGARMALPGWDLIGQGGNNGY
jgi:hypothetical protein